MMTNAMNPYQPPDTDFVISGQNYTAQLRSVQLTAFCMGLLAGSALALGFVYAVFAVFTS
jgi:hypothetical protein